MKKQQSLLLVSVLLMSMVSQAGTVRIYNNDSKIHKIELNCQGSRKILEVKSSQTSTYTFHSSASECDIKGGTVKFPVEKIVSGNNFKFKNNMAYKTW